MRLDVRMSAEFEKKSKMLSYLNESKWLGYKDPSLWMNMDTAKFDKIVERLVLNWFKKIGRTSGISPQEKEVVNKEFKEILYNRRKQFGDAMMVTNSNLEEALAILEKNHSDNVILLAAEEAGAYPVSKAETLQPSAPPAELLSGVVATPKRPTMDDFKEVKIPGDGDCLFASVFHATGKRPQIQGLRDKVANWIQANKYIDIGGGRPVEIIEAAEGEIFEAYIMDIRGGKWGGDLEVRAISSLLGINIVVYYPGGRNPKQYFYSKDSDTIFLINSGDQGSGVEHYNALIPNKTIHITEYMDPDIKGMLKGMGFDVNDDLNIRVILSSTDPQQAIDMLEDIRGKEMPAELAARAEQAEQETQKTSHPQPEPEPEPDPDPDPDPDPKVKQLYGMGFKGKGTVQEALRDAGGNVSPAAAILLSAGATVGAAGLKPKRTKKRRKKKKSSGKRKKTPAKKKKQTAKKKKRTERR